MTKKQFEPTDVPKHWWSNTWEDKARENPLFAVMTTPNYSDSDSQTFTEEELAVFWDKGRHVYDTFVKPRLGEVKTGAPEPFLVEYGCGMGRILKAAHEDGKRAGGVDISPTMIEHCRRLVPAVADDVYVLDADNRSAMPDACADLVFSFAVLKHIHNLEVYDAALAEMTRIMKPGAVLVLNVNCQDFISGSFDRPERTVHFDDHSEHYLFGEDKPYRKRTYSTWSGVYIGYDRLRETLKSHGVEIYDRFHHTMKKPQGIWVVGRKA